MKTKQIGLIALLAIITLALIACKEDEPEPKCECAAGTEHLFGQPCCEGTGCNCQVYYGVLPNGVKIYKGDNGVTDAQMATVVTGFKNQFENLTQQEKTAVNNTLTKIRIISDKDYTWDGHILGIKFDYGEDTILGFLQGIAYDDIPLAE